MQRLTEEQQSKVKEVIKSMMTGEDGSKYNDESAQKVLKEMHSIDVNVFLIGTYRRQLGLSLYGRKRGKATKSLATLGTKRKYTKNNKSVEDDDNETELTLAQIISKAKQVVNLLEKYESAQREKNQCLLENIKGLI